MEENIKLKNLLKHLYEGKEFHTSFEDEVYSWNGDDQVFDYEEYSFTYKFKVKKVYGKDSDAVASVDLIITDFQRDGDDFMWQWDEDRGIYNHDIWYIVELEERVVGEMIKDVPISIHLTIWSIDEYED
jgi:hypothetical protein